MSTHLLIRKFLLCLTFLAGSGMLASPSTAAPPPDLGGSPATRKGALTVLHVDVLVKVIVVLGEGFVASETRHWLPLRLYRSCIAWRRLESARHRCAGAGQALPGLRLSHGLLDKLGRGAMPCRLRSNMLRITHPRYATSYRPQLLTCPGTRSASRYSRIPVLRATQMSIFETFVPVSSQGRALMCGGSGSTSSKGLPFCANSRRRTVALMYDFACPSTAKTVAPTSSSFANPASSTREDWPGKSTLGAA